MVKMMPWTMARWDAGEVDAVGCTNYYDGDGDGHGGPISLCAPSGYYTTSVYSDLMTATPIEPVFGNCSYRRLTIQRLGA